MYVWFPVFLSRWSKMIGYDNLICNVVWCYGTCLQASLLSLFCLEALFLFFVWPLLHQCINQDNNSVYAGTNLWHKIWYDSKMIPVWYGIYAIGGVDQWSLMCTSNVAGNTQMASLDRQVTQNGLGVINCNCKGNIQWCRRGYRPWRWWVAVFLM